MIYRGAVYFVEATTDDVRLVLRLLHEGTNEYCYPLNYVEATSLIKDYDEVVGVKIRDADGKEYEVKSSLVINATGVWADELRHQVGEKPRMRPLRGSHMIFSRDRLPVNHAISFLHPIDGRPVFAYPWEGATLVGTTDLDYQESLEKEPSITPEEIDYLMLGLSYMFPDLNLKAHEAISTFAGVRPIISSGKADPSQELRDHAIWVEHGMMTVTGGKYTTFRIVAREALEKAESLLKNFKLKDAEEVPENKEIDASFHRRIHGYYGNFAETLLNDEIGTRMINGTEMLWIELIWGARHEAVEHLSDLLLRRTRLGLLLPNGASEHFDRIKNICLKELNWNEERWEKEKEAYLKLIEKNYFVPKRSE